MDSSLPKTVFITGASSGIGLETARYFFDRGWNVVATMRHPEKRRTVLHDLGLPDLVHLDVMDEESIWKAVRYALDKHQKIDVLVNNAGYAVHGPFEATLPEQVGKQFNTNVFGLLAVARAVLPHFRQQGSGILVNVASMGGRIGFPLYTLYNSTKWAVEGFSEALRYELKPLKIKVRIIEPGVIKTDFYARSMEMVEDHALEEAYGAIQKRGQKRMGEGIAPEQVAKVIYRAATDPGWRLRYPVGADAALVSFLRWLLPERAFFWVLEKATLD